MDRASHPRKFFVCYQSKENQIIDEKFEQDMGVKKVTTKSGKQLFKSTTMSNYSSKSKSSQDKDEERPNDLSLPKLDTKGAKKKFNKLGTFTFGDNSPYRSTKSPNTAKLLRDKVGTLNLDE